MIPAPKYDPEQMRRLFTCDLGCGEMAAWGCAHFAITTETTQTPTDYVMTYTRKPTAKGREAMAAFQERIRKTLGDA